MRTHFLARIVFAVAVVTLTGAPGPGSIEAQQSGLGQSPAQNPASTSNSHLPSLDPRANENEDPNAAVRREQVARLQNSERQKRIVDDTARLLKLANELKEDVDKSNKDQMSLEVIRKADEVERLAHDVKIRMRG